MKYVKSRKLILLSFSLVIATTLLLTGPHHALAGGELDTTFSGDGKLTTDFDTGVDRANDVAIQPDGKIVVAGWGAGVKIARYNPGGTLDTTFSGDGKITVAIPGAQINTLALQPDGKIVVAGQATVSGVIQMLLLRFNPDGSFDLTFDGDGIVFTVVGAMSLIRGIAMQPDGKIVAVGTTNNGMGFTFGVLARYNPDGSPDTTFGGGDGRASVQFFGQAASVPEAVVVLSGGKILAAGRGDDFAVGRYNTDGSLDLTFGGGDGTVLTDFNNDFEGINDMKVQPDGKIVVAGYTPIADFTNFALARYTADGVLDPTFSGDGKLVENLTAGLTGGSAANGLAIQSDGKIVAVGSDGGVDLVMARFRPDGTLDTTFGLFGRLHTDMINNSADTANAIAIQADGKLVVVGTADLAFPGTENFAVVRYLPGGTGFDYDGDARADMSVFRPATGAWYLNQSTAGSFGMQFGNSTDRIAPADYDGDGKTDIAVYRPSEGRWYIVNSSNGTVTYYIFGVAEELPAPADYDGDGKVDICIFRPSIGTWYRQNSSNGSFFGIQFGTNGDRPTVGDFDGDAKGDIGIWRPSNGDWYHIRSSNGTIFGERFGISTDKMVPADYDGDGKMDIAVWRPSTGIWYIKQSSNSGYRSYLFGLPADIPAPADFDGDGKADLTVFRPTDGTWYITNSSNGSFTIFPWGQNGDRPTPAAFLN